MFLWFTVLAVLAAFRSRRRPAGARERSIRVTHSLRLAAPVSRPFFALGAVFLAITGAEALYADMGHFGGETDRFAWSAWSSGTG